MDAVASAQASPTRTCEESSPVACTSKEQKDSVRSSKAAGRSSTDDRGTIDDDNISEEESIPDDGPEDENIMFQLHLSTSEKACTETFSLKMQVTSGGKVPDQDVHHVNHLKRDIAFPSYFDRMTAAVDAKHDEYVFSPGPAEDVRSANSSWPQLKDEDEHAQLKVPTENLRQGCIERKEWCGCHPESGPTEPTTAASAIAADKQNKLYTTVTVSGQKEQEDAEVLDRIEYTAPIVRSYPNESSEYTQLHKQRDFLLRHGDG